MGIDARADGQALADLRYRSLFDRHPDAVFEFDLDGRFVGGNATLEQMVGYPLAELIEMSYPPLVHADDVRRVAAEFRLAVQGEVRTYDARGLRRDGSIFDVHVTNLPIVVDGEVVGVYGIARDVTEERTTRRRVAESEARFRSIFEASEPGMTLLDLDGRFLQANEAYCAMLGTTEADLQTTDIWSFLHPEDLEVVRAAGKALLDGTQTTARSEARHVRRDGEIVWLRARGSVVRRPSGEPEAIIATVEDVTARKEAEARARRDGAVLKMAGAVARFGGWTLDAATEDVHWSLEIHQILEFAPGQTPTMTEALALYPPADRHRVTEAVRACLTDGTPFDLEVDILTATGRTLKVRVIGDAERDADGRIVAVRGAFQDITAQHEGAARNRRLAERLSRTLETISEGVGTLEPDWTISYINGSAARVLGRSYEDLVGRNLFEAYPELEGSEAERTYRRALEDRVPASTEPFFSPQLGTWFEVSAYPVDPGIVVYFQDVTERVEREHRLEAILAAEQQAAERLREVDRVKTTFLTAVSHELRTPLTVVQGMALTLQRFRGLEGEAGADDSGVVVRHRIEDALVHHAERLTGLLDELLDLDRLERGTLVTDRRRCDVAELARDAVRRSPARPLIALHAPDHLPATVDRVQVARILDNLLDNAAKYAPTSPIALTLAASPDHGVRIEVADEGPGIPADQLTRVFEPFARTGDLGANPGTGIGLALVAAFADLHGGRAWAEPSVSGAHLVVELPGRLTSAPTGPA